MLILKNMFLYFKLSSQTFLVVETQSYGLILRLIVGEGGYQ